MDYKEIYGDLKGCPKPYVLCPSYLRAKAFNMVPIYNCDACRDRYKEQMTRLEKE